MAPHGQHLALRAPFSLVKEGTGLRTGTAPSRHPASIKRVNRVKRGNYYLRVNRRLAEPTITSGLRQIGNHTLCHDVRGTPEGEGRGDIDRSPQINEPSTITSPPSTLALSSVFSLPTLCFLSLALSHTPAPPAFDRGRCERAKDRQRLYCEVITQKTRSRQLGVGHTG